MSLVKDEENKEKIFDEEMELNHHHEHDEEEHHHHHHEHDDDDDCECCHHHDHDDDDEDEHEYHHHHHDEDDDDDDCECCHDHHHHHDEEDGCDDEHDKHHHHHHEHDDDDDCDDEHDKHHHHHHHCECCSEDSEEMPLWKILVSAFIFLAALLVEKIPFIYENFSYSKIVSLALYAVSYILVGLPIIKSVVRNIIKGKIFNEDFLMGIATIGAIFLGEYTEAVAVMLFFQLGEYLEDKAVDNSRKSISKLVDIRPDSATVKTENGEEKVLAKKVKVGQTIIVRPGERIPLDGKIVKGNSFIDTSALTGEAVPVEVFEGMEVLSGSVNQNGILEITVEKAFAQSTVSRVLEMVEKAQNKKSKTQKFISRFAKVYTPIVCIVAVAVFVIPSIIFWGTEGFSFRTWIYRALELLVVSCPCALVISIPLSFFAGIGRASLNGVLVKGSNYLELLSKTKVCVFDKTGTLTQGVFEVNSIHLSEKTHFNEDDLIALATHAEYYSNHPISVSLKKKHSCPECGKLKASEMQEIPGRGIKCVLNGSKILVGNQMLMDEEKVSDFDYCFENHIGTVVHIACDGKYAGHILISDKIKEDSKETIANLKKLNVKTVMLTGDSSGNAKSVAEYVGVDEFHANLLPQDKVSKVEELMKQKNVNKNSTKKSLVFVGDGINDSPVLALSDVGIAMGAMGSDAAIEASDIVIMDDKISRVKDAIKLSKKTMLNVKENIVFALLVKLAIIALCIFGKANMWMAIFGDVGVTLLAILNSTRLLIGQKRR